MARTAVELMWIDALAEVARADRLRREFFCPASRGWEPPIDLLQTSEGLILVAALPGVRAADVDLAIGRGEILITGVRRLPAVRGRARIHRMELPHGRFERRVTLPRGTYELVGRDLADGCLTVILRELS
jgi:HSP20 family molecular chaperone IbpA